MATAIFYQDREVTEVIEFEEPDVNCSNCRHASLCCIAFRVPLTPYESQFLPLDEKSMKMGMAMLAKKDNGECTFLKNGRCLIWSQRPMACREYSCKGDKRMISL